MKSTIDLAKEYNASVYYYAKPGELLANGLREIGKIKTIQHQRTGKTAFEISNKKALDQQAINLIYDKMIDDLGKLGIEWAIADRLGLRGGSASDWTIGIVSKNSGGLRTAEEIDQIVSIYQNGITFENLEGGIVEIPPKKDWDLAIDAARLMNFCDQNREVKKKILEEQKVTKGEELTSTSAPLQPDMISKKTPSNIVSLPDFTPDPIAKPDPNFLESAGLALSGDPNMFKSQSTSAKSYSSTSAAEPQRQHKSNEEVETAMKSHVGGYGLGLILGIVAFMLVRPKAKSRMPKEMARRWMSWGLMGGMTTGTTHFFRYGGAEGIAGALLGICFFSGAAWVLGFFFGLIKFSLFPKIFSKPPALPPVKPAEIPALREASGQGDASAQYQLGMAYFAGEGVVKNHIEAYKWILLAQAGGHADAKRMSAQIEKTLSRQELAEGQKLATEIQGNT